MSKLTSLDITIFKAANLKNIEVFGTSDPYVSVEVFSDSQKTKTIENNLNPEWNEKFHFDLSRPLLDTDNIVFKVKDKDPIPPDKLMGRAEISCYDLIRNADIKPVLTLTDEKNRPIIVKGASATLEVQIVYTKPPVTNVSQAEASSSDPNQIVIGTSATNEPEQVTTVDPTTGKQVIRMAMPQRPSRESLSSKTVDFQVRIRIVEGRQLQGANIDPVCRVSCSKLQKQTRILRSTNSPCWNQVFYFNFRDSARNLVDEIIKFSVFDSHSLRRDSMIGSFKFDIGYAYHSEDRAIINKWLLLSDPDDPLSGPKGYLKVSVIVLGPGDQAPSWKSNDTNDDDIQQNLLRPAGVTLRPATYAVRIYNGEDLPRMDNGIISKAVSLVTSKKQDNKNFVDPYVEVNFAGIKNQTKKVDETDHPDWNQEIRMILQFPSMCENMKFIVYDWDRTTKNDPIGAFVLNLNTCTSYNTDDSGYLPTFGPCYVNLYGSAREYSDGPNQFEALNLGEGEGCAYRGRILIELNTHLRDEPEKNEVISISEEQRITTQKFMRRRNWVLHANFMMATMINKVDGNVVFEMSIANFGNTLDENLEPSASTTPPTNPVFDGMYYYFLPWGHKKPSCIVEANLEDITPRLYAMNLLMKITKKLEQNLEKIEDAIKRTEGEKKDYDKMLARLIIKTINELILSLNQPLPDWSTSNSPMNALDINLQKLRRKEMARIKDEALKLKQECKNINDGVETLKGFLNTLKTIGKEPQNSMPDIIIWMLVGKKRHAYARIPANEILYASNPEYQGEFCGRTRTIFFKIPQKPSMSKKDQAENFQIPALIRVLLWFGLESDEQQWHAIPNEANLELVAETYEYVPLGLIGDKGYFDHTGTRPLPKESFQIPENWSWEGDWDISPELSLIYTKDAGLSSYTEELYEHEQRFAGGEWTPAQHKYTDADNNPIKGPDEFVLPSGWIWEDDWTVDMHRPVDEMGWEYHQNAQVSGYVAVQKMYHLVRRKRLLRKRILSSATAEVDKQVLIEELMQRKIDQRKNIMSVKDLLQYGEMKSLTKGMDSGWEYAITKSSMFHSTEKPMDSIKRRRWHRKLKPNDPHAHACVLFNLDNVDQRKKNAFSKAVPRMYLNYPKSHTWHLRAYIFQARNLIACDSTSYSDPYARVCFAHMSQETETIDQSLCPTWDQTLLFNRIDMYGDPNYIADSPAPVIVEIFDKDDITSDDFMGRALINPVVRLNKDDDNKVFLNWYKLDRFGTQAGEILAAFELILIDNNEPPPPPPRRGTIYSLPPHVRPELERTRIEILSWGVRGMKKYHFTNVDHPMAEFVIGKDVISTGVIASAKRLPNFAKNHFILDVNMPCNPVYMPPITVNIRDNRVFGRKPIVGTCQISKLNQFKVNETTKSNIFDNLLANAVEYDEKSAPLVDENAKKDVAQENSAVKKGNAESTESLNAVPDPKDLKKRRSTRWKLPFMKKSDKKSKDPKRGNIFNYSFFRNEDGVKIDLTQLDEDIDWWSKYYYSQNMSDKCRKYAELYHDKIMILNRSLEDEEAFERFEDFIQTFKLERGNTADDEEGSSVGEFKGKFFIQKLPEDLTQDCPSILDEASLPSNGVTQCEIFVYIIKATNLQPNDPSGLADPYVEITCGNQTVNNKNQYIPNNLDPEFGRVFHLTVSLPIEKDLVIKVLDHDLIGFDDVIGQTHIDIENRLMSKYRGTCGLPNSYYNSGPYQWRDQMTPFEILEGLCDRYHIPKPTFHPNNNSITIASKVFYDTFHEDKKVGTNPHLGPVKERIALGILNRLPLVKEHIEKRKLYSTLQPDIEQGTLEMFVDIFPKEMGEPGPAFDIKCRQPKKFELRVIIWNTVDVILDETSITGEKMSDIYVKAWISAIEEHQETDVHYRSLDGDGNFNWRMIFPFDYVPAENLLVVNKKEGLFSRDTTELRVAPRLIVQVWDNDNFSPDDFLGTLELNLTNMVAPAKTSKKCSLEMVDVTNTKRKMMSLFECNRAYGFWPFINDEKGEAELTGKVEMELELLYAHEALAKPAGKGRDEPNENPHLDPPNRPETSFLWFTSPWKTFKFIVWKRFKWVFIGTLIAILLGLLLFLFIYAIPGLVARKAVGV